MTKMLGLLGLVIALAIGMYIYSRNVHSLSPAGAGAKSTPRDTINIVGVRNDLIAIANGERRYFAAQGKYASLEELRSNGDISMTSNSRGYYNYSAEAGDSGFRVTATYSGPPNPDLPSSMSIDESMQIRIAGN